MNDTAIATPPTKQEIEFHGNSSLILLNKFQDLGWLTLSILYIPNQDFSSNYTKEDKQFYLEQTEFQTVQIYSKLKGEKVIGFYPTEREGLLSIVNLENNYYTIFIEDQTPSIIGARRDYFIPFIPVDEDFFEDMVLENNQNQKDKEQFIKTILNTFQTPFEQITNKVVLPKIFQNYKIKGGHCEPFH